MILHEEHFDGKIRLQIVNGDDIMKSYKNCSKVSSCMSEKGRWKRTKFYSYVPDCSLIRLMRGNILMLRALLWATKNTKGKTVKVLDGIYYKDYPNNCLVMKPSIIGIGDDFLKIWKKFADTRSTYGTKLTVGVNPLPERMLYPSLDTFQYMSKDKTKISNHLLDYDGWLLDDYENGRLNRI
ncbi:MAG: hypothetical protein EHM34_06920 [Nitrosopumilales archaeon]|nr:MAG: hypothetical protein EHM34_06920 [Nitrosopumilales archaeon]